MTSTLPVELKSFEEFVVAGVLLEGDLHACLLVDPFFGLLQADLFGQHLQKTNLLPALSTDTTTRSPARFPATQTIAASSA